MIQIILFDGPCPSCKQEVNLRFLRSEIEERETGYRDIEYTTARCPMCSEVISYEDIEENDKAGIKN